jgi:hypothetical protein
MIVNAAPVTGGSDRLESIKDDISRADPIRMRTAESAPLSSPAVFTIESRSPLYTLPY